MVPTSKPIITPIISWLKLKLTYLRIEKVLQSYVAENATCTKMKRTKLHFKYEKELQSRPTVKMRKM